jgi:hypothetical protein
MEPKDMTYAEPAREMHKREDSLDHFKWPDAPPSKRVSMAGACSGP